MYTSIYLYISCVVFSNLFCISVPPKIRVTLNFPEEIPPTHSNLSRRGRDFVTDWSFKQLLFKGNSNLTNIAF